MNRISFSQKKKKKEEEKRTYYRFQNKYFTNVDDICVSPTYGNNYPLQM